MKKDLMNPIFTKYNLGIITAEPEAVEGGLIHRMWKVDTAENSYAVKQLNPLIINKPGLPDDYVRTEIIARTFAEHNIPAVAALFFDDSPLIKLDDAIILIYPWIEGFILDYGVVDTAKCQLIGRILGQIHALDLNMESLPPKDYRIISRDELQELIDKATNMVIPWAFEIQHDLPLLTELINNFDSAIGPLKQNRLVSHRDMDVKNIIWVDDKTPQIIDWEAAGLTNPTVDLLELALEWSGQWSGHLNGDSFQAYLNGYHSACQRRQTDFDIALMGCYGARCGWLEFNMRRSIDERVDQNERFMAENQVTVTLNSISNLHKHADNYRQWFTEIMYKK